LFFVGAIETGCQNCFHINRYYAILLNRNPVSLLRHLMPEPKKKGGWKLKVPASKGGYQHQFLIAN